MHTPEQAKALWCPMVRAARREVIKELGNPKEVAIAGCNTDAMGGNRVPASCSCVADRCAMWRWLDPKPSTERTHAAVMALANLRGYCGLAGSPST